MLTLRYAARRRRVRVPLPVISVGGLELGGSGKTPVAIEIARRLLARGLRVAILSRGYRGGDEAAMAAARLPGALVRTGPDRAVLAAAIAGAGEADVIVLDDGLEHRRLARDLDVVVGDAWAARPWLVRRRDAPPGCLRWWHRRDGGDPDARADVTSRFSCEDAGALRGARAFLVSGIARPAAFEAAARRCGATVVGRRRFPDHHRFSARDLAGAWTAARRAGADCLLATEKDAARIALLPDAAAAAADPSLAVLRGHAEVVAGGETLDAALDAALALR